MADSKPAMDSKLADMDSQYDLVCGYERSDMVNKLADYGSNWEIVNIFEDTKMGQHRIMTAMCVLLKKK